MLGLRGSCSVARVAALVVALGAVAVLAGCGGTAGTSFAPGGEVTQGSAADSPAVVLHGYTFGSASDHLTHPYFKATAATPKVVFKGWGKFAGQRLTMSFASGGSVAGVRTLRLLLTMPGDTSVSQEYSWYAQDTQGNVHMLKRQEVPHPAQLLGVAAAAAGGKPYFCLVRNSLLRVGYTWYAYEDSNHPGHRSRRFKVLSTTASVRGQTGLLQLQDIIDENVDGVFNPSWTGPDQRQELYFEKTGFSLFNITRSNNPPGGVALK